MDMPIEIALIHARTFNEHLLCAGAGDPAASWRLRPGGLGALSGSVGLGVAWMLVVAV